MDNTEIPSIQAVAYLRGHTWGSLDRQLTFIRERAEQDGVTITHVYADVSTSLGNCPNRDQMIANVAGGKISSVYVYCIDRLTRNRSELMQIVSQMKQHNVTLWSVLDEFDTSQSEYGFILAMLDFSKIYRPAYRCKHQ